MGIGVQDGEGFVPRPAEDEEDRGEGEARPIGGEVVPVHRLLKEEGGACGHAEGGEGVKDAGQDVDGSKGEAVDPHGEAIGEAYRAGDEHRGDVARFLAEQQIEEQEGHAPEDEAEEGDGDDHVPRVEVGIHRFTVQVIATPIESLGIAKREAVIEEADEAEDDAEGQDDANPVETGFLFHHFSSFSAYLAFIAASSSSVQRTKWPGKTSRKVGFSPSLRGVGRYTLRTRFFSLSGSGFGMALKSACV